MESCLCHVGYDFVVFVIESDVGDLELLGLAVFPLLVACALAHSQEVIECYCTHVAGGLL